MKICLNSRISLYIYKSDKIPYILKIGKIFFFLLLFFFFYYKKYREIHESKERKKEKRYRVCIIF